MATEDQMFIPRAEFIEDVGAFLEGQEVEKVIEALTEHRKRFSAVENQLMTRKARLLGKLPEIQKALDIVTNLISKDGAEVTIDYELAEAVYAKTKVANVKTVNLWLGADVMVEYELHEAKALLETNLSNCKSNIATTDNDLSVVKDQITTLDVSISRVWNYDVERRRLAKGTA